MALAYTPGLKVKEATIVRRTRRLPISGDVLVKEGDAVTFNMPIAKTNLPGDVHTVNVASILCLQTIDDEGKIVDDLDDYLVKKLHDPVKKDEVIAQDKGFFGLFKHYVYSPIKGDIVSISKVSGAVAIQEPPVPVTTNAYISGKVVHILPNEGAVIETSAALIQGIFGLGGETHGELFFVADSTSETLSADQITPECAGKILVGGALVTGDAIRKAVEGGAKGIVVGGIEFEVLIDFLGYEIGVAITGRETIGLTLIITEGFGKMNMAMRTFQLLKSHEGKGASMNGTTQIRAGVIRPEIIIPGEDNAPKIIEESAELFNEGMTPGMQVRIIREPYFGALGQIVSLPIELQTLETGSKVRVLELELEDGKRIIVPRANVEIIEF